jgi:zinc protease
LVADALDLPTVKKSIERTHDRHPGLSQTITKPGSVQVSIRMGKKCQSKADQAAYFDAVMFNHVLGGFFGSRLMKNIREEKGLTYGIYSHMNHFFRDDFWMIGAEVNQKNVKKALLEIRNEIKILQGEPMSQDELDVARNYFIGSWRSENSTLFSVADKMKSLYLWGLPENYYAHMLEHIANITPRQIQESAQRHFGVVDLLEVQVG